MMVACACTNALIGASGVFHPNPLYAVMCSARRVIELLAFRQPRGDEGHTDAATQVDKGGGFVAAVRRQSNIGSGSMPWYRKNLSVTRKRSTDLRVVLKIDQKWVKNLTSFALFQGQVFSPSAYRRGRGRTRCMYGE
jgi:hypothetical protein